MSSRLTSASLCLVFFLVTAGIGKLVAPATASTVWNMSHTGVGNAYAQVFDGGDNDSGTDSTTGTTDFRVFSLAFDATRAGAHGASALSWARSSFSESLNELKNRQSVRVSYGSSFFSGGDGPGGRANSDLTATIDLLLPTEFVEFQGSFRNRNGTVPEVVINWNTLVENLTTGTTFFKLDTPTSNTSVALTMFGSEGDTIRISTVADAALSDTPAGRGIRLINDYSIEFVFTAVPEPTTATLTLTAALYLAFRRRRVVRSA